MKRLFVLAIIFFSFINAQVKADSILQAISKNTIPDQIKLLSDLCWEYRSKEPEFAIKMGMESKKLIEFYSQNLLKAQTLNYIGVAYSKIGEMDSAYYYYQKALEYAIREQNILQIAYANNNIGDYFFQRTIYPLALEKFINAFQAFEKLNDITGMAYALNELGELYLAKKDYEKALENLIKSAEYRAKLPDQSRYASSLINIAKVYTDLNMLEKALDNYNQALEVSKVSDYIKGESWVYSGLAEVYISQKKFDFALNYSIKAIEIDSKINNSYGVIANNNRIGLIYLKLKKYNSAKGYLQLAKNKSLELGYNDLLMDSYKMISEMAESEGDYLTAYRNLKEYQSLYNKINSFENTNQIADIQTAFMTEKQNKENELLKKEIDYQKTTRNYLIIISVLILIGILLFIRKYINEKKSKLLLEEQQKTISEMNNNLIELNKTKDKFFSIISHDLRSPFQGFVGMTELILFDIDSFTKEEIAKAIKEMNYKASSLYKLLKNLLEWARMQRGLIEFQPERKDLKTIIEQAVIQLKESAKIKEIELLFENSDSLYTLLDEKMIDSVIRNLISNAIKFTNKKGKIIISLVKKNNDYVIVEVVDNGLGIPQDIIQKLFKIEEKIGTPGTEGEESTGLGLILSKEFIEKHNGEIWVESQDSKGSKFSFSLPIK